MDALVAKESKNLSGKIKLKGAKNSILPIIAACVLTSDEVSICNCPNLSDVNDMLKIVQSIGGKVDRSGGELVVCCNQVNANYIDKDLMKKIRSSIFILGPLVARCGEAEVALPGGCEIGARPIDLHLDGLKKLGVKVNEHCVSENCAVTCRGLPRGGMVRLKYPSVGATENLMMAAALCDGRTVILGAAREPEVVDLAMFLNTMGARVYGAGSNLIIIDGKKCLHGARYKPITDRIAAGTFVAATAVCGGDVFVEGAIGDHMDATVSKFRAAGVSIIEEQRGIRVCSNGRLKGVRQTVALPYPGFPTDMQPILVAALATADGDSAVTETLFENRFRYTYQLERMGAKIIVDGNTALISGAKLCGAEVYAQDLRGGAALTVAALKAEGTTVINGVEHIDRGYEAIEADLALLGANICRTRSV